MKRIICAALCALLLAACAAAEDVKTVTFGGSARDRIGEIAVSADGLIAMTGWTESSDGSFAWRTKTGYSGWLEVIDREGNSLVSFCTRLGNHDHLELPVFHEDGTLTAMLFAEMISQDGWVKLELLRFDMEGNVLSRKVLREESNQSKRYISNAASVSRGYILTESVFVDGERQDRYFLYDFDGQHVGQMASWSDAIAEISDGHVIRQSGPQDEAYWLYRCEADGSETALCEVPEMFEGLRRTKQYAGFFSLPDGGAAGVGWTRDATGERKRRPGVFTHWDAQGRVVSEMITPGVQYGAAAQLPGGGYAALGYSSEEDAVDTQAALYLLDERGVMTRTIPLDTVEIAGTPRTIAALGDGTIVVTQTVEGQEDDTKVTIIAP